MRRTLLLSSIVGGIVLLLAGGAGAASGPFGALQKSAQSSAGPITLVRHGGPMMGMHMHSAGPRIAAPQLNRGLMLHAHNFPHVHDHHRRFFFAGVPYYDYSYDDSNCWWSRRYHHWVCPSYY